MKQISLSQQAYEVIKRKIISLELPPGTVIDEAILREELGFGRTPIREALLRLSQEKLVLIVPRRGMFVTEIVISDLQKLYEARLTLEPFATRQAAKRGTNAHWERMAAALANSETASKEQLISIDEKCHRIIYEAADNQFLRETLTMMYALSVRLWYYSLSQIGNMQDAVMEHRLIMDALMARDGDEAERLMANHIRTFQEEFQAVMLR